MNLNLAKLPHEVAELIPLAEKWGIGDDYEREEAVKNASPEQLLELARCLDRVEQKKLFDWLAGPESRDPNPSPEYVAFTCLTMAIDSAKLKLR